MQKIIEKGYIEDQDVKDIKFRAPILLTQKLTLTLEKIARKLEIKFDSFLELLGLKEEKQEQLNDNQKDKLSLFEGLFDLFIRNAYINEQPNELLLELTEILSKITSLPINVILNSDKEIYLELISRSIFRYRNDYNKGFLLSKLVAQLNIYRAFPLLNGTKTENLNEMNQ